MKKPKIKGIILLFGLLYVMLVFQIVNSLLTIVQNPLSGMTLIHAALILIVLGLTIYATVIFKFGLKEKIQTDAVQVSVLQQQYLEQWDYPYAILENGGRIVWFNREFEKICAGIPGFEGKTFLDLMGDEEVELPASDMYPTEKKLIFNGRHYFIRIQMIRRLEEQDSALQMYSVSMTDITRQVELEKENIDMKTVVCLLYVDNYDTIFNSIEEGRGPLLEAMIYRKLNDMATSLSGILTKLEKDRFFLIFPHKAISILENNKFAILEEVRKISIGNSLPVTLSIGIGVEERLDKAQSYARAAVDLALGRGGDQAVIKNSEKYLFYGGTSSGVEKNTRVRARLIAYALKELINDCDRVLIMGHKNPDLDCLGASLGMFRVITELKKPAYIVMGDQHPAVDILFERVTRERDYREVFIDEQQAKEYSGPTTLVIMMDVNRAAISECASLLEWNSNVAVIDHHRTSADHVSNAAVSYVEPYASSASEMVTEILQYIAERIRLKPVEADGLFAGMALDTKNFTQKTGVRTFEAAAYLRRNGADAVRIRKLFRNDIEEYKAKAYIVSKAVLYKEQIAIAHWEGGLENTNTVAAQAADELLDIEGIHASFVLSQGTDVIYVSARSLGDINVQLIMEKLGGGGHLMMAGAQLREISMEEALEQIKGAIETYMQERQ